MKGVRYSKIGKWNKHLRAHDVESIYKELNRVIVHHSWVRSMKTHPFIDQTNDPQCADLTQELFCALFQKQRFQHYLETGMTDVEIEVQISQIELKNILTEGLRKRYPESYRLARRISTIVKKSKKFKSFGQQQMASKHQAFGLAVWGDMRSNSNTYELEARVSDIPMVRRDISLVGCTGNAQLVISNSKLEQLIVEIIQAIGSPMTVRDLRLLVMKRLPIMDVVLSPMVTFVQDDHDGVFERQFTCMAENPEQLLLIAESKRSIIPLVRDFFQGLQKTVRSKPKQYDRMLKILWYYYLDSKNRNQLEVAGMLGVSDSLVSDYRKRIEKILRTLPLERYSDAKLFETFLRRCLSSRYNNNSATV